MSLTKPFINTISAFDATKDNNLPYLSVLGGDIITSYTYRIYNANTNVLVYSNTIVVGNDKLSNDIRTFGISIPSGTCLNNNSYYIVANTTNGEGDSANARSTPFNCYLTPCVSVQYSSSGSEYLDLASSASFSTPSINIRLYFDTIDLNSVAMLNSLQVNLYGVKSSGIVDSVYSGNILYNEPFQQTIGGLTNTTGENAKYIYYKLTIEGITVDGMVFSQINIGGSGTPNYVNSITNLGCTYVEYGAGGNFFATNDCENGRIEINYSVPKVENNPFGDGSINAIASDETNVYCGGGGGQFAIYNISSGIFGSLITNPFGLETIYAIATDGVNVYCGGGGGQFAIYNISSGIFGSLITNPFGLETIYAVATDGVNVYCGGGGKRIAIYNISSGTFGSLIANPFGSTAIRSCVIYSQSVYFGSDDGSFAIYNISSGIFGSLIANPFDGQPIYAMATDGVNVYCGGGVSGRFSVYDIVGGTFGSLITNPFGSTTIVCMSIQNGIIYCGGGSKFCYFNVGSQSFSALISTPFSFMFGITSTIGIVYCGGSSGVFSIYNPLTNTFANLVSTPLGDNDITAIGEDDDYLYCGGENGEFCIYDKLSGEFGSLISTPIGAYGIKQIVSVSSFVYISSYNFSKKFVIYDKINKTFSSSVSTPFLQHIELMCADINNVYCVEGNTFAVYDISSGTFGSLITNPFGLEIVYAIATDGVNVYCGGGGGQFAIYNISSGIFGSLIANPFDGQTIYAIATDGVNVYCGGGGGQFAIYNISSGTFGGLITNPFGGQTIYAIGNTANYMYLGGTLGRFCRYEKQTNMFSSLISTPLGNKTIYGIVSNADNSFMWGEAGGFVIFSEEAQQFVSPIKTILQRKLLEETNGWIDLQELFYLDFKVYDTYNQNGVAYEYRLIAKDNSSVGITCSVLSQFAKSYICDSQTLYDITNELAYGSNDFVQETTLYSPIGSEFPFMTKNARTKYNKGTATALLFAPTTRSGDVDRMAQVKLVKEFNSWLTNGTCKVLKDINGNIGIYFIQNSVNNNYYKELGNGLAGVSFEYAEAGRFTQLQLQKLGMLNNFLVVYV